MGSCPGSHRSRGVGRRYRGRSTTCRLRVGSLNIGIDWKVFGAGRCVEEEKSGRGLYSRD